MLWQCVCGVCVPIIKPWGLSIERWFRIHTPLAMRERGIKLLLKGRQNSWLCALEFVYFSAYDLNNAMYIWIYSYLQPVVHIYYNTCKGLVVLFISLYNESRTLDNFTLNQSDCYDCCSTYYAALLPRQRNFFFFFPSEWKDYHVTPVVTQQQCELSTPEGLLERWRDFTSRVPPLYLFTEMWIISGSEPWYSTAKRPTLKAYQTDAHVKWHKGINGAAKHRHHHWAFSTTNCQI